VTVESSSPDGLRVTYSLDGTVTAGDLVARLATGTALRDLAVVEPDIEEVVARLYADSDSQVSWVGSAPTEGPGA